MSVECMFGDEWNVFQTGPRISQEHELCKAASLVLQPDDSVCELDQKALAALCAKLGLEDSWHDCFRKKT